MTDPLNDLQDRLKSLKKEVSPPPKVEDEKEGSDLGKAYELIATPIVAGGIGAGIDHIFSTSPVFFIILAVLGVLAGFWALYKADQNQK